MSLFNSSSIVAGGYDARSGTLRLRYIDGDTYDYRNVPFAC
jgi:KTSC domain